MWAVGRWPLVSQRRKLASWKSAKGSWEQRTWAAFKNTRQVLGQDLSTLGRRSYLQLLTLGTWDEGQAEPKTGAKSVLCTQALGPTHHVRL